MPSDPQPTPRTEAAQLQELLDAWEARGLRWTVSGRLALITAGGLMLPATSSSAGNTAYTLLLLIIGIWLAVYSLLLLRKPRRLAFVGYAGVSFDLFTIYTLAFSWYYSLGGEAISRAFVVKNELVLLCLMLIVIESLAMRPVYPLVTTAGSIVLHLAMLGYALGDPRLVLTSDIAASTLGAAVHPGLYSWRIVTLALIGGALAWLARSAQRVIRAVVELEQANRQIRETQAEMVMQGKMAALASLVAGITHEINTPLGVVISSVGTAESCTAKLSQAAEGSGPSPQPPALRERVLSLLNENLRVSREAAQRIASLLNNLKDFVGLDQADVQDLDLETGIDRALSLIQPELQQQVNIVKEFCHPPPVRCRPKEINQVVMTLLRNAFEAMEGPGTLRIRTAAADSRVTVEIADSGKGLTAEQLARLFDVQFAARQGRVAMDFGLPLARSIIDRHGGSIAAESAPGQGTVFRVSLPLQGNAWAA